MNCYACLRLALLKNARVFAMWKGYYAASDSRLCNALQHTATHCNALQRTATHCNALQHTAMQLKNARVSAMWKGYYAASDVSQCNALQHTATHCNTAEECACDYHVEGLLRRLRHATLDRRIGVLQCLVLCCSVLQYL